jgi:HD superfamily phosphohydrolase
VKALKRKINYMNKTYGDRDHDHDLRIIKEIKDPIHNAIPVSYLAISIIDTPEYQSLRRLCQLGTASYVFPSANHKRFEHCLGVYHLTRKYLEHLTSPIHNYHFIYSRDGQNNNENNETKTTSSFSCGN